MIGQILIITYLLQFMFAVVAMQLFKVFITFVEKDTPKHIQSILERLDMITVFYFIEKCRKLFLTKKRIERALRIEIERIL